MGKHSLRTRRSITRGALAATTAAVAGTLVVPALPAQADDVDDLIAEMDKISHEATAKMEEIKGLEDQIGATEQKISDAQRRADEAKSELQGIRGFSDAQRKNVGGIAQSRYRIPQSDAVLTTLDSGNPQEAIDRSAYLDALNRNAQRALDDLADANRLAADKATAANIARADAQYTRIELQAQRAKLESEREDLEGRVREVESRVNSLNDADRQRWINKDNPLDASMLPGVDSGIVGAAMAQLGKPYGWGATGPDAFDCSGLMVYAYAQNGISIPRTSQAQLAGGTPVPLDQLQPGDIIGYYPGVTHVGMYIGDGMVVHSSDYGIPIQVVPADSMPIQGAVRY